MTVKFAHVCGDAFSSHGQFVGFSVQHEAAEALMFCGALSASWFSTLRGFEEHAEQVGESGRELCPVCVAAFREYADVQGTLAAREPIAWMKVAESRENFTEIREYWEQTIRRAFRIIDLLPKSPLSPPES